MSQDYIEEYLKQEFQNGMGEKKCEDGKSSYTVNVKKCLPDHCLRSDKARQENGKCPKKRSKKKSKKKLEKRSDKKISRVNIVKKNSKKKSKKKLVEK